MEMTGFLSVRKKQLNDEREEYVNKALNTPNNNSKMLGDSDGTDDVIEVYAREKQAQHQELEPQVEEEPPVHVAQPEVQLSAPTEATPAVGT